MAWRVLYHPEVYEDLEALGQAEVRRILKVISDRIQNGEPDKLGKALRGALIGCRRIRTGNTRIVYRVNLDLIEVLILAVGMRREQAVYEAAQGWV